MRYSLCFYFFFFNDTATTEIYTLSLHDALPICLIVSVAGHMDKTEINVVHRHDRSGGLGGFERLRREMFFRLVDRSEEHTSELQSQSNLVCRLLLEKKKITSATQFPV